jgi:serine/threonine protein kinase
MNISEIHQQPRAFFTSKRDEELEDLAKEIFNKINYCPIDSIETIAVGYDFDTFKVKNGTDALCFKYSMDVSAPFFAREAAILKQLHPFCPELKKNGNIVFGEKMQYMITSFEHAESMAQFGVGSLFEYSDSFFYSFDNMTKVKNDRLFSHYLENFFDKYKIENIPAHFRESINELSDLNKFCDVLSILKSEIEYLHNKQRTINSPNQFCHGNLKPSNVLVRGGLFKFVDFFDSFCGSRFFDWSYFLTHIGLPLEHQKQLVESYFSAKSETFDTNCSTEYNLSYNLAIRLNIYQAIFHYLVEAYVYSNSRPHKLMENISFFMRNEFAFANIPTLQKHKGFLFENITNPILES